jgi:hypothetical protein
MLLICKGNVPDPWVKPDILGVVEMLWKTCALLYIVVHESVLNYL